MHLARLTCAGLRCDVHTDSPKALAALAQFMGPAVAKDDPDLTITVIVDGPHFAPHDQAEAIGTGDRLFELRYAHYIYSDHFQRYYIHLASGTKGVIDIANRQVTWKVGEMLHPRSDFHTLVLDPVSIFAPDFGIVICHGAVIFHENSKAIALLGSSGSGKSTLAFLLSHDGPKPAFAAMGDDTFAVVIDHGQPVAAAIPSGFGLNENFLRKNPFRVPSGLVVQRSNGKVYLRELPNQHIGTADIGALFHLERCSDDGVPLQFQRLSAGANLRHLLHSQTTIGGGYLREKLAVMAELARRTSGVAVRYSGICDASQLRDEMIAALVRTELEQGAHAMGP